VRFEEHVCAAWRVQELLTPEGRAVALKDGRKAFAAPLPENAPMGQRTAAEARTHGWFTLFNFEHQLLVRNLQRDSSEAVREFTRMVEQAAVPFDRDWQMRVWIAAWHEEGPRRELLRGEAGLRAAADWALEEGELLALRWPEPGARLLEFALNCFLEAGEADDVSAFIAGVRAVIARLHAHQLDRAVAQLPILRALYERLRQQYPGLPEVVEWSVRNQGSVTRARDKPSSPGPGASPGDFVLRTGNEAPEVWLSWVARFQHALEYCRVARVEPEKLSFWASRTEAGRPPLELRFSIVERVTSSASPPPPRPPAPAPRATYSEPAMESAPAASPPRSVGTSVPIQDDELIGRSTRVGMSPGTYRPDTVSASPPPSLLQAPKAPPRRGVFNLWWTAALVLAGIFVAFWLLSDYEAPKNSAPPDGAFPLPPPPDGTLLPPPKPLEEEDSESTVGWMATLAGLGVVAWLGFLGLRAIRARMAQRSEMALKIDDEGAAAKKSVAVRLEHARLFEGAWGFLRRARPTIVRKAAWWEPGVHDRSGTWRGEITAELRTWETWLRGRRVPIALISPLSSAKAPWELRLLPHLTGVAAGAAAAPKPWRNYPLYRWLPTNPSTKPSKLVTADTVFLVSSPRWQATLQDGWKGSSLRSFDVARDWFQIEAREEWPRRVRVLHLVGRPVAATAGVALLIDAGSEFLDPTASRSASTTARNGRVLVTPGQRGMDQIPLVVVQAEPSAIVELTETDRRETQQVRGFCADVFVGGARAILMLPALQAELASPVVRLVAEHTSRATRLGLDELLILAREVREVISTWRPARSIIDAMETVPGSPPPEQRLAEAQMELALNVTVFARHTFKHLQPSAENARHA
jgi:hypothetical protein